MQKSLNPFPKEIPLVLFAGGTDAKIIKSISEGNTACSLFTGGTEVNNQQSISEGNTLLCLLLINYF